MKIPKTPDEQIKEFEEQHIPPFKVTMPKKSLHWYQIPLYFALIVGFSSLMAIPFLLVLALLKYLGVI